MTLRRYGVFMGHGDLGQRRFQLWAYTGSHSQLLLRSTRDETHPTRVDVLFKGVAHVQIPTVFEGLRIEEASAAEVESLLAAPEDGRKAFALRSSDGSTGYVIALAMASAQDEADYFAPSQFDGF